MVMCMGKISGLRIDRLWKKGAVAGREFRLPIVNKRDRNLTIQEMLPWNGWKPRLAG
jgi:hypothetical protein